MQFKTAVIMIILVVGATSFISTQQAPWPVPEKAAKTANPVKTNAESKAAGKTLWTQYCVSCHGKTGKGDGAKAGQLKTHLVDFTAAAFQSQSDGAIFYKTSEGRTEMPGFKKAIPEAMDIWDIVNYMRTFKK